MNDNVDGRLDQAELDIGQLESEGVFTQNVLCCNFHTYYFSEPEQR